MTRIFFLAFLISACQIEDPVPPANVDFTEPVKVNVTGYTGNIMEPFISRDGAILVFNNLNALPENTNLHWATRINDTVFLYRGEIEGVNTASLEGVPSMDAKNKLYFVSLRSYQTSLSSIYQCNFSAGIVSNVEMNTDLSKMQAGWLNFDLEISANGQVMYFVDGQFGGSAIPETADLVIAQKNGSGFTRLTNSAEVFKNINTSALEYAACISVDQLELYFTRLVVPVTPSSVSEIFYASRENINSPFSNPVRIRTIIGFAEAPTIAPDQKTVYYHRKENDLFSLYMVRKK